MLGHVYMRVSSRNTLAQRPFRQRSEGWAVSGLPELGGARKEGDDDG